MFAALREFIEDCKTARRNRKARAEGASRAREFTVVLRWAEPYAHYNITPEILHVRAATTWAALMSAQLQAAQDNADRVDEFTGVTEIPALLSAPTLPGKTNLLLRWTNADGADARYLPLPNPLAGP